MAALNPFLVARRRGLHGLGDSPLCLDQNQNAVDCQDPNCTYGDCGAVSNSVPSGSVCLDQNENSIACSAPDCTFGDCISAPLKAAGGPGTVPRPSPTVANPIGIPQPRVPQQQATFTPQVLMNYLPLILVGVFAVTLVGSSSGGRRR